MISTLPNSSQINFIIGLVLAVLMPGRTPDLSFDRVSRLTTDSLTLRFFHEYHWFGVLELPLVWSIDFSQTARRIKQNVVICWALIVRVPARSSCSDSYHWNGRKACEAPYSTTTKVPATTPDKQAGNKSLVVKLCKA